MRTLHYVKKIYLPVVCKGRRHWKYSYFITDKKDKVTCKNCKRTKAFQEDKF